MRTIRPVQLTISRRLRITCSAEDLATLRQIVADSQRVRRPWCAAIIDALKMAARAGTTTERTEER